ncbi:MAG: HAD family hydrolase [Candidatus Nephthysia bennettiae]|nr:MAG: HAD family hydrolase [Candidatus Dormibacteraeota bacterium]
MTDEIDLPTAQIAKFVYEMGFLKQVKRSGWSLVGITDSETVAEHSFRTALIGLILACEEGADVARTALLCLLHDSQESRTGDIASVGRPYVTTTHNVDVTADQTVGFPQNIASTLRELVEEYEAGETLEAKLAHEADKLECVYQAREYQTQRAADTSQWIRTCSERITSGAGRRLLRAAINLPPASWWQQFQESYNRSGKSIHGRRGATDGDPST